MTEAPTFTHLLDEEDRTQFLNHAYSIRHHHNGSSFLTLASQAAWLTILKAFEEHPDLEELAFEVDDYDVDKYVLVMTRRRGQDEFNGLGEDPEHVDEHIQSHLNDMGRNMFTSFHRQLSKVGAQRDALEEQGEELFGSAWAAARRERQLQKNLPETSCPPGPTPRL